MDQRQVQQLLATLQELKNRIGALEQRMSAVERSLGNLSGPSTTGRAPRRSNRDDGNTSNRTLGSQQNAGFLPFTLEALAAKYQNKSANDESKCSVCGRETFHLDCFRAGHFHWCRVHGRPILHNHRNCGRDYAGCHQVQYEVHPDWENIVRMSFATGLGTKGVRDLEAYIFPPLDFPHKWNNSWFVRDA